MCTEVTKRRLEEVEDVVRRQARIVQSKWQLARLFSLDDMCHEMYCAIIKRAASEPEWLNSPDLHIAIYARGALTTKLLREAKHGWFDGFEDQADAQKSQDEPMVERWIPAETRKWNPEAVVIGREALHNLLDGMRPKRRAATLLFAQGYTIAEIAHEISAPHHVVKEWIVEVQHGHAAREWLKQAQGNLPDPQAEPQRAAERAREMYQRGYGLMAIAKHLFGSSKNDNYRQWVRDAVGVEKGHGYDRAYYNSHAGHLYRDPIHRRRAAEMRKHGASLNRISRDVFGLQRASKVSSQVIKEAVAEYDIMELHNQGYFPPGIEKQLYGTNGGAKLPFIRETIAKYQEQPAAAAEEVVEA